MNHKISTLIAGQMKVGLLCGVFFSLMVIPAHSEATYITDDIRVMLRSDAGTDRRIIAMPKAGTRVEVLKETKDGWSKVRLPDEKEGWLLTRYLSPGPPTKEVNARLKSENEALRRQVKTLTEKKPRLKSKLNDPPNASEALWRAPRKARVLSIGVGDFGDKSIPSVHNAVSDARYFASFAQSVGIPKQNINCLTDHRATRSEIGDALRKLRMATTEESETAIFYFSGHGAPLVENGKIVDSILVPYDAKETSLEFTGIKVSTLRKMVSEKRGNWILVLDACFTGKEGRSLMAKNLKGIAVVPKDFRVVPQSPKNSWWITATSGDNFANDFPKEKQGLFTYYFLKALNGEKGVDANEDGLITLREAFEWTKSEVEAVSAKSLGRLQVPELIGQGDTILTIPR